MRKGIALQIGGIMMIAISIAVLFVLKQQGWAETTYVTFRGEVALSAVHEVELTRKVLNENSYFIAQRAAAEILKEDITAEPNVQIYKQNLLDTIKTKLPQGTFNTSYSGRKILWADKNIDISSKDCSLDINSRCFYLSGIVKFSLSDETIDTEIESQAPIDQKVDSSFFRIVSVAKDIFSNNRFDMTESELSNLYPDLTFTKTLTEITIEDRNCLNPGELYCLYPIDPSQEIGIALDLPWDFLKTKIIIPQAS